MKTNRRHFPGLAALLSAEARRRQNAAGPRIRRTVDLGGGVTMATAFVPAGEFVMGDARAEVDEHPAARVRVDRPKRCRSAFRLSCPAWQKVYNVGFRIECEPGPAGGEVARTTISSAGTDRLPARKTRR